LLDAGTACVVGETVGVDCFVVVVAGCADAVVVVGSVTCGIRGAVFAAAPGAFWASAGTLPATGGTCGVVAEAASDVFCVVDGACAVPAL